MKRVITMVGLIAVAGCGGGSAGSGGSISSHVMAGKIGGKDWTFGTGEAFSGIPDPTQFLTNAYAGAFAACTDATPFDTDRVVLALPKMPGTYALSANLNETFFTASSKESVVATTGTLVIESVTATTIKGGGKFSYNADNAVDGQFQATICP